MILRLILAICCLVPVTAAPQVSPPPQTEQVETGTVTIEPPAPHNGLIQDWERHYRIRLLPISSFPQLPDFVAQQLVHRGCMIPQTYEAREPENVIHGSFEKKGSDDWAVLCSVNRVSTLYVFFQSDLANPISLRHQPDSEWLGVEWSLDYGSAWGIATHPARLLKPKDSADHDGIDDAFVEKSISIHYFENGRWTTRDASQ